MVAALLRIWMNDGIVATRRQMATAIFSSVAMMKRRPGQEARSRSRGEKTPATSGGSGSPGTGRRRAADGSTGSRGLPMRNEE